MTKTDIKSWAKEEVLTAIDRRLAEFREEVGDWNLDCETELVDQRRRVAKFLGMEDFQPQIGRV